MLRTLNKGKPTVTRLTCANEHRSPIRRGADPFRLPESGIRIPDRPSREIELLAAGQQQGLYLAVQALLVLGDLAVVSFPNDHR